MARYNFNANGDIAELPIEDKRYEASDNLRNGLCVRVSQKGSRTFIWRTRHEGQQKVVVVGDHPRMSVNQARVALDKLKEDKEDGALFTARKTTSENIATVRQLAEDFYNTEIVPARTEAGSYQCRMILDKYILPTIGSLKLRSLKAPQVKLPVIKAMRAGYALRAEALLRILKQMFSYGEADGIMDHSPAAALNIKRCGVPKAKECTRMLDETTLPLLWNAVERHVRSDTTRIGLKILILSGVRSGELRLARWKDVNFKKAEWFVPDENSKTTAWTVPLPSHLMALFKQLHELTGDTKFMFPTRDHSEPACRGVFINALNRVYKREDKDGQPVLDIPRVSPHNFWRTVRTIMGDKLDVDPYVAEGCLNHKVTGVESVYNKAQLLGKR
jgi:integrase